MCPAPRRAVWDSCPASLEVPGPPCQETPEICLPGWLEAGGWRLGARGWSCKAGNGLSLPVCRAGGTHRLPVPRPAQAAARMCTDRSSKPQQGGGRNQVRLSREWTGQSPATGCYCILWILQRPSVPRYKTEPPPEGARSAPAVNSDSFIPGEVETFLTFVQLRGVFAGCAPKWESGRLKKCLLNSP